MAIRSSRRGRARYDPAMVLSGYDFLADAAAGVLLILFGGAWAWMSYLTVRQRWNEPSLYVGGCRSASARA